MRTFLTVFLSLAALLIGAGRTGAADGKPEGMRSLAAREAKALFEFKQAQAEKEFREKMAGIRKEYMGALEKAKEDATKRADLDEAIAIRAEVEDLKKADAATAPAAVTKLTLARNELAARLARTSWSYPVSDSFTFNADGTLTRSDNWTTGVWTPVDERSVLIVYAKGGMVDRITFEDKLIRAAGCSYQAGKTWEPRKVEK